MFLGLSEKMAANISPTPLQIGASFFYSSSLKRRLGGDVLSLSEKMAANISPNVPSSRSYFTRRRQVQRGAFIVVFSYSLKRRPGGDVLRVSE